MYKIVSKRQLAENINEYKILAPLVVRNAKPGQFIILRVDEFGERIPFTICGIDLREGTVSILVQTVGYSTALLATKNAGDYLVDFVGPLGKATDLDGFENVVLVGGGIGSAVIYPQAEHRKKTGKPCDVIVGARNKDLLLFEKEFRNCAKEFFVATDDGSYGRKGFVLDILRERLQEGGVDAVMTVGPLPMMRAVCATTLEFSVHTLVSMNSLMVDGTGMCGCCRLTVGGETKYACVNGPEFDGHLVDWEEAIGRSRTYSDHEKEHYCRLTAEKRSGV